MLDEIATLNHGLADKVQKFVLLDEELNMTVYRKNDHELVFECENLQDGSNPHKIILDVDDMFETYDKLVSAIEEANKEK